jgi:exopolysaccharide biosynthesis WecB/TagA/CpsF family protein
MHDLSGGGVERMRLSLIEALRERGLSVSLILGRREGPLETHIPTDLSVISLNASRTILELRRLNIAISEIKPDILVASLDHNNIVALLAKASTSADFRLIICQHNALSAELALGWKYGLVPLLYKLLHKYSDAVVAVSRGVANDLCHVAKLPRNKISVIHNPVIGTDFEEKVSAAAPHPWFSERSCPIFVFIGRLTRQKDVGTLLLAMQRLLRRRDARLILVGEGDQLDELRRMTKRYDISYAVDFVGFQSNPLPWIKNADALISSSRYEGLGNAIIEALACGTPVIATDCSHGPAEILLEGTLGTLVPVGDFEALAEAMENLNRNEVDTASLLGRAGDFTASACAREHIKLFERVLGGSKRSIRVLGIHLSPLSAKQAAEVIIGECNPRSVKLLVTPNIDHVRLMRRAAFADAYSVAELICADGFPVLLYARLRGLCLTTRVTGCDVFSSLISHPQICMHRLYCVVESKKTLDAARAWFDDAGFGSRVEIACAPVGLTDNIEAQITLVRSIREFEPSIVILTLGAPVSEEFAHRYRHILPPCWIMCVGQALRVHLGLTCRAPFLLRKIGLEWLWRVYCEPSRLSARYVRALLWFPIAICLDRSGRF